MPTETLVVESEGWPQLLEASGGASLKMVWGGTLLKLGTFFLKPSTFRILPKLNASKISPAHALATLLSRIPLPPLQLFCYLGKNLVGHLFEKCEALVPPPFLRYVAEKRLHGSSITTENVTISVLNRH